LEAFKVLVLFALTLATFLALDAVWLGVIARKLYSREIGHLLAPNVRWGAAVIFYVLYVTGLLTFVVLPRADSTPLRVALLGALFGLVAYATYDLTNLATLSRWPMTVTLVDLAWGALATAAASVASRGCARWLLPHG
jgi:uncharacterized membrane protein